MNEYQARFATPFAVLGISTWDDKLAGIDFLPTTSRTLLPQDALSREVCKQLERYLREPGFSFDLPLALSGTEFQKCVWSQLLAIPSGIRISYAELALRAGSGARAVANACGANAIPVIIPCHRVVARQGLGGFMHGHDKSALSIKQWLLTHEGS